MLCGDIKSVGAGVVAVKQLLYFNLNILRADADEARSVWSSNGKKGEPRENPPSSDIVQHVSHVRKSRSDPAGDRTRFSWGTAKSCFHSPRTNRGSNPVLPGQLLRAAFTPRGQSRAAPRSGCARRDVVSPWVVERIAPAQQLTSVVESFLLTVECKELTKLNTTSTYTRQIAKSKYRNRIRLERASQKQYNDTHKTSYDRMKRCQGRKINIKASERVNTGKAQLNTRQLCYTCAAMRYTSLAAALGYDTPPPHPGSHPSCGRRAATKKRQEECYSHALRNLSRFDDREKRCATKCDSQQASQKSTWGRGGEVVRLLTSHLGEQGSIPGGVAPAFWHVGIAQGDAAGRRVFSGTSRFPAIAFRRMLHSRLVSPTSALKTSLLRAAQISELSTQLVARNYHIRVTVNPPFYCWQAWPQLVKLPTRLHGLKTRNSFSAHALFNGTFSTLPVKAGHWGNTRACGVLSIRSRPAADLAPSSTQHSALSGAENTCRRVLRFRVAKQTSASSEKRRIQNPSKGQRELIALVGILSRGKKPLNKYPVSLDMERLHTHREAFLPTGWLPVKGGEIQTRYSQRQTTMLNPSRDVTSLVRRGCKASKPRVGAAGGADKLLDLSYESCVECPITAGDVETTGECVSATIRRAEVENDRLVDLVLTALHCQWLSCKETPVAAEIPAGLLPLTLEQCSIRRRGRFSSVHWPRVAGAALTLCFNWDDLKFAVSKDFVNLDRARSQGGPDVRQCQVCVCVPAGGGENARGARSPRDCVGEVSADRRARPPHTLHSKCKRPSIPAGKSLKVKVDGQGHQAISQLTRWTLVDLARSLSESTLPILTFDYSSARQARLIKIQLCQSGRPRKLELSPDASTPYSSRTKIDAKQRLIHDKSLFNTASPMQSALFICTATVYTLHRYNQMIPHCRSLLADVRSSGSNQKHFSDWLRASNIKETLQSVELAKCLKETIAIQNFQINMAAIMTTFCETEPVGTITCIETRKKQTPKQKKTETMTTPKYCRETNIAEDKPAIKKSRRVSDDEICDQVGHFPRLSASKGLCRYCRGGQTRFECAKCDSRLCLVDVAVPFEKGCGGVVVAWGGHPTGSVFPPPCCAELFSHLHMARWEERNCSTTENNNEECLSNITSQDLSKTDESRTNMNNECETANMLKSINSAFRLYPYKKKMSVVIGVLPAAPTPHIATAATCASPLAVMCANGHRRRIGRHQLPPPLLLDNSTSKNVDRIDRAGGLRDEQFDAGHLWSIGSGNSRKSLGKCVLKLVQRAAVGPALIDLLVS
ncbi:hypothetical protein PR048_007132 [Dryococelus australis]|uniref:Uncharacterized protein n=1 Tax=Dryococelus australis TaxID=614101 RepID=A0ABQ9ICT7_9NEOP|nr:hypothetical protein PR048_007132 [Dryococelus australis]